MSAAAGPVLTVDLGAVAANTERFAALGPALMAVVKADGFGHGAVAVAATALEHGARSLGVTGVDEAVALRDAGLRAPVLSWLNPPGADLAAGLVRDVGFAVADVALLDALADAARRLHLVARLHLHADTGMARDGAAAAAWPGLCRRAAGHERAGRLRVTGVMGHLARAAEPGDPSNAAAAVALAEAVAVARRAGLRPAVRHLAATAAALDLPAARLDLLRVGAGLYGIDPAGGHGLRRALRLTAPVVTVRDVPAGTGVGYGHAYRTPAPTRLALLPVGYADGVPPAAAGRGEVALRGRRCRVVGAVSMDQTVVDVGDLAVRAGDLAVVFGPGDAGDEPTTGDWARWCGVPEHAVMTGVGPRVRRVLRPAPPAADGPDRPAVARRPAERRAAHPARPTRAAGEVGSRA